MDYWSYFSDASALLLCLIGYIIFKKYSNINSHKNKTHSNQYSKLEAQVETILSHWDKLLITQKINALIKHNSTFNINNFSSFVILDLCRKYNFKPEISTINILLDITNSFNDFHNFNILKDLIWSWDDTDKNNISQPDIITFNIFFKNVATQIYRNKLKLTDSSSEQDVFDIKTFAKNNILSLTTELKRANLTPNEITFNTIIDITVESELFDLCWKYFHEMCFDYGLEPDAYTFSTILKTVKNYSPPLEYIDKAFDWFEKINECSSPIHQVSDTILHNCLLEVCAKYNKKQQAEIIYKHMGINSNNEPNSITYSIMIKIYGNNYEIINALSVFDTAKNKSAVCEVTYGCILNACIKNNAIRKCCEIYNEIKEDANIEMNIFLYTTLIKGYTKTRDFTSAFNIYTKMMNDPNIKKDISIVPFNSILDACVECNKFDVMISIYKQIKDNSLKRETAPEPDIITYSTVIKGYAKMKNIDEVINIFNFLKVIKHLVLDEVIYNSIIDACAKNDKHSEALNIYNEMCRNNIKRSNATYSVMIKIYSRLNLVDKAESIYHEMLTNNIKPSLITYTAMIQIMVKSKRIQKAIDIFQHILQQELCADQVLYNVIINGCVFNGRLKEGCFFWWKSFDDNVKLCNDAYRNVLNNLLTNRTLLVNEKNEITLQILRLLKDKEIKVDYEMYSKLLKMVYKDMGKQGNCDMKKLIEEYKERVKDVKEDDNEDYYKRKSYKKDNDRKPRNENKYVGEWRKK